MALLSVGNVSRLGCWLALKVTRSGSAPEDTHSSLFSVPFPFFLGQRCVDEGAYINPVYSPLFLLNYCFLPAVMAGMDWFAHYLLIFWLSCHFEVRSKPRCYTTMTVIGFDLSKKRLQKPSLKRPSATHTHTHTHTHTQTHTHMRAHTLSHPVDPVLCSGGEHSDGIIHSETKICSWSMEPSAVKFTVATSAPAVYNVASLSCANWRFSVHKSPKKKREKETLSSPVFRGSAGWIRNDLNLLIREGHMVFSSSYLCRVNCLTLVIGKGSLKVWAIKSCSKVGVSFLLCLFPRPRQFPGPLPVTRLRDQVGSGAGNEGDYLMCGRRQQIAAQMVWNKGG